MWEYKFVVGDDRIAVPLFEMIRRLENITGYRCRLIGEVVNNDFYFDTDDLDLDSLGVACRVRHESASKEYALSLKRGVLGPDSEVIYLEAGPIPIGRKQVGKMLRGDFSGDYQTILQIFAGRRRFRYLLKLGLKEHPFLVK